MKTENIILMKMARESLKGKWGLAIGSFVIFIIISSAISSIPGLGSLVSLIISGPFILGISIFSLSISRNKEAKLTQIFSGFKQFERSLVSYLLMVLYVLLWALLFIIPGIIRGISYSMVFYILADDESIKPKDALFKSKNMMYGYKSKLFRLMIRFLGLSILCIFTLGIGFLWLIPYMHITYAKFYDDIKDMKSVEENSQATA